MDGLDPDMVYEVPDTPDRSTIRCPTDRSSKPSWERVDVGEGINCSLPHRDIWHSNKMHLRRHRDSTQHDGRTMTTNSHEDLFRQADLARSMLEPAESKPELGPTMASNGSGDGAKKVELGEKSLYTLSHPTRSRDLRRKVANHEHNGSNGGSTCTSRLVRRPWSGNGITLTPRPVVVEEKITKLDEDLELRPRDKGKGIDLCSNLKPTKCSTSSSRVIDNNKQSEVGYQNLTNSVDLSKSSFSARSSDKDNRNEIDLYKNTESNMMEARSLRSTGRRRLVRNGCISPLNIERGKSILKEKHDGVENNGVSSHEIYIVCPDSDDRHAEKLKGKVTVDDIPVSDDQQYRERSGLSRVGSLSGKEVTANVVKEDGTDSFQDKGWRTTRAHRRKPSIFPSSAAAANGFENDEASSHPFYQSHETAKGSRTAVYNNHDGTSLEHQSNIISVSDSQTGHVKGKRKFSLTRARTGECSSSTSGDLEMLNLQSSRQALNLRSVRGDRPQHKSTRLGQVIEVDDDLWSPEVDYSSASQHNARASDHSVDRARQVESDEMLARQLQEELYNETLRTGGMEEIDATIAWSLLQEEDGHRASHRRENQSRRRDTSSSSARAGSHQSFPRATNRGRRPMSSRMAQLRRELNRPVTGGTGLDMRLDFLEALELTFGGGNDTPRRNLIHRVQRDFNENDYEMLLALDENNNHTGASERQINNLPQSVIQNVNPEETCAVCLEAPTVGETIRHLPCLHKFHKECIDSWLRRKMSCPICKSGIT